MSPSAISTVTSALTSSTTQTSPAQTPALFSLAGKTVAITGGGRGLGITLAFAVVEAGGHAACLDILPEPSNTEWQALTKLASQLSTTATYRRCDVTSEAEVTQVLDEISHEADEQGAPLNGMVACAGIQQRVPALDYEASDFERMLRVNVVGAFISVKRAARILKDKGTGGSIVLIASMSGQVANRVRPSTSTPKRPVELTTVSGSHLHRIQRQQIGCSPNVSLASAGVGAIRYSG
jgi:NAD(P)-dependent dehydrogenase (short-subunit alcohol dehydrogenase family)